MAQARKTPGVYIEEKNAFPGSVVEVATAIPAFIGYTEKADRNGRSLLNKPTRITSFADFLVLFGGEFSPKFDLVKITDGNRPPRKHKLAIGDTEYEIKYDTDNELYMFRSIQLFFSNGGGACYIVAVGTYGGATSLKVDKAQLLGNSKNEDDKPVEGGLKALLKEQEPTMIVVPDAVKLPIDECYEVYANVLGHCAKMQSRVAIFDVHGGDGDRIQADGGDVIDHFREKIGTTFLNYGAAYYPWLQTTILAAGEITFRNFSFDLKKLLPKEESMAKEMIDAYSKATNIDDVIKEIQVKKEREFKEAITADGPPTPVNPLISPQPKDPAPVDPGATKPTTAPAEVEDPGPTGSDAKVKAYQKYLDKKLLFENYDDLKQAFDAYSKAQESYEKEKSEKQVAFGKYETAMQNNSYRADYDLKIAGAISTKAFSDITQNFTVTAKNIDGVDVEYELEEFTNLVRSHIDNKARNHHQGLLAASPTYKNVLAELTEVENLLPPSAAMAGLYTMVDNSRGVWKSPANVSVNSVIKPSLNITHDDQEMLNVDAMSGKSINAIRTFPGIGTLVWGGRTLDGNSLDWRYINVRRTIIMLEQSIKLALRSYVFEPNDANTWVTVRSMITNFLTDKWKQGALAGSSPDDAFSVDIGLGSTMTSVDILEGKMLVTIKLAIVRPAEFIVVTFQQQMQKS